MQFLRLSFQKEFSLTHWHLELFGQKQISNNVPKRHLYTAAIFPVHYVDMFYDIFAPACAETKILRFWDKKVHV